MKTESNVMGFYIAVSILIAFVEVGAIDDYCSKNTYNDSDNYMHFSKEATFEEFALRKKFKGLNCCAKGYRSIEWYVQMNFLYLLFVDVYVNIIYQLLLLQIVTIMM